MTTICFCLQSKKVSCDSRITADGEIITDEADKRTELNGIEFFMCGALADMEAIRQAFVARKRKVRKAIDLQALAWDGETLFDLSASNGELSWHAVASNRGAIGSGSSFAATALQEGKTPRQAVITAKKHDSATGGKVVTHKLVNSLAQYRKRVKV